MPPERAVEVAFAGPQVLAVELEAGDVERDGREQIFARTSMPSLSNFLFRLSGT